MLGAALLIGCAASTPDELRARSDTRRVFMIDANYQLVLKRLVKWDQECTSQHLLSLGYMFSDVEHYPAMRQATITRGGRGAGQHVREVVDLRAIGPDKTEMTVYAGVPTAGRRDEIWQQQLRTAQGDASCSR